MTITSANHGLTMGDVVYFDQPTLRRMVALRVLWMKIKRFFATYDVYIVGEVNAHSFTIDRSYRSTLWSRMVIWHPKQFKPNTN